VIKRCLSLVLAGLAFNAWAGAPSADDLAACQAGASHGRTQVSAISFQAMSEEEGYWKGYTATTVTFKGKTVGYARKDHEQGIAFNERVYPLKQARLINLSRGEFSDQGPSAVLVHRHEQVHGEGNTDLGFAEHGSRQAGLCRDWQAARWWRCGSLTAWPGHAPNASPCLCRQCISGESSRGHSTRRSAVKPGAIQSLSIASSPTCVTLRKVETRVNLLT
jgi:hypothetical protein